MVRVWSEQKAQLYRSVESVLTEAEPSEANFQIFLETIDRFCTQTKAINVAFITAVLQKLAGVLKVG